MSGLILQFGCGGYGVKSNTDTSAPAIYDFSYDKAAIPKAKPWTSENFKNNPDNFQLYLLHRTSTRWQLDPRLAYLRPCEISEILNFAHQLICTVEIRTGSPIS